MAVETMATIRNVEATLKRFVKGGITGIKQATTAPIYQRWFCLCLHTILEILNGLVLHANGNVKCLTCIRSYTWEEILHFICV
jgi:hypothetical protein